MGRASKLIAKFIPKRRIVRYALLGGNLALLIGVGIFVIYGSSAPTGLNSALGNSSSNDAPADPLDQLSSADIAVNLSRMATLDVDEKLAVTNQADSVRAELAVSVSENVVAKPQVVATKLKSKKDIQKYNAVAGDDVGIIAAKFGVTSETIRWSNDINGNTVAQGKEIWVLPGVNGIITVVKPGDTPDKLAQKYSTNKDQIIAYNDAEINGLPVGSRIIIPDGKIQTTSYRGYYSGFSFGSAPIYGFNGYIPGWCTWYVANRVAVPTNWGNANTWDSGARASGWTVSSVPKVGAVAQTDGRPYSQGHVGVVEAVSEDGKMIKYSDMNGLAGFNHVGYSDWVPVHAKFQNFIYR